MLGHRSLEQRKAIAEQYVTSFGKVSQVICELVWLMPLYVYNAFVQTKNTKTVKSYVFIKFHTILLTFLFNSMIWSLSQNIDLYYKSRTNQN